MFNSNHARIFFLLLSLCGCATNEDITIDKMSAPKNVLEFLANCKMAIDKNLFLRNDFYSKSYLAADFGAGKFSRLFENDGKPVPFTRIGLNDFSSVMPSPKPFSGILSIQIFTTTEGGRRKRKGHFGKRDDKYRFRRRQVERGTRN